MLSFFQILVGYFGYFGYFDYFSNFGQSKRNMCFLEILWDFDKLSNAIFLSIIGWLFWLFWLFLAILAILTILAISVNQNAKCVF